MGWGEDIERMQERSSTRKALMVGPLALVTAVVFFARRRTGEGVAVLVMAAVMTFFGVLSIRAERKSRPFEDGDE